MELLSKENLALWLKAQIEFRVLKGDGQMAIAYRDVLNHIEKEPEEGNIYIYNEAARNE